MSQTRRRAYITTVALTLLLTVAAVGEGLARHKQITLDPVLADAAGRAASLQAIQCVSSDAIVLTLGGHPLADVFAIDNGRYIVVDLYGALNHCPSDTITPPSSEYLQRIRTSLFALEPQFISRVVLDMAVPCGYSVKENEGKLTISLSPRNRSFDAPPPWDELVQAFFDSLTREERRLAIRLAAFDETYHRSLAACADHPRAASLASPLGQGGAVTEEHGRATRPLREEMLRIQTAASEQIAALRVNMKHLEQRLAAGQTPAAKARESLRQLQADFDLAKNKTAAVLTRIEKQPLGAPASLPASSFGVAAGRDAGAPSPRQVAAESTSTPRTDALLHQLTNQLASLRSAGAPAAPAVPSHIALLARDLESVKTAGRAGRDAGAPSGDYTIGLDRGAIRLAQAAPDDSPEPVAGPSVVAAAPAAAEVTPAPAVEPAPVEATPAPAAEEKKAEKKTEDIALPEVKTIGKKGGDGVDPLDQLVNIDFYKMDLNNVVGLLAQKAQINVIAGTEIPSAPVTANIQNVPLRKAIETVLRMNGLGIVEEEGIWRIVSYEEAMAHNQVTKMIYLLNAQADTIKQSLDPIILTMPEGKGISVSANPATNVVILTGPPARVRQLEEMITALDVAKPTLPTITEAIKLNYAEPKDLRPIVESMLTKGEKGGIGRVEEDERGRNLIVTDMPVVVEQVRELVKKLDVPTKQVGINAMIVDAVLSDASQTGVDWLLSSVRHLNARGNVIGSLQNLGLDTNLGNIGAGDLNAGAISFGVLTGDIDLKATIAAEVNSKNAKILANPVVVTIENKPAEIQITQEFPYQEFKQSTQGPPVAATAFKPIGVTMKVTPRITHDNDVIVEITAKQSSVSGLTETGVPIEDKREASSTLRTRDGQTVFIGGLRNVANRLDVSKVPILGDVPVLNFMFRNTKTDKVNTELLIFLTCNVAVENLPELTPAEQKEHDALGATPRIPDSQRALFRSMIKPGEMRDPMWKWRRTK